ncbi:MAG: D-sedoheptulose 7-phosphate isomerase [Verrucomicrobiales bacterium]|nr:D-sedoheptulose 7-phosphate isomerase [Verrucomicrobiales bacterium]
MSQESIRQHFEEAASVLHTFLESEANFEAIAAAGDAMVAAIQSGRKVISCGNGGSMCDAMHFAEELSGQYRDARPALAAVSISDPSHLTCVGNDYGFNAVFARYVEGLGQEGDVLLGISTSGNSSNVINAAKAAREKGITVVGLTGKTGGQLAELCDIEIRVPWEGYSDRIQEIHIKVIHSLIDHIELATAS